MTVLTSENTHVLAARDVDGDGLLDVLTSNDLAGWALSRGKGDGTFLPPATYLSSVAVSGFSFGDLDRDGRLDVVTAQQTGAPAHTVGTFLQGACVP